MGNSRELAYEIASLGEILIGERKARRAEVEYLMGTRPGSEVLERLRRAVLRGQESVPTDSALLVLYLTQRDEAAFAALVRRHGPMVLGVCRRVLGNAVDAEDAFQATFLVLVRKAGSVRPRAKLATWLHGVAYHVALKARAAAAKRRVKESEATAMNRPDDPDERWTELLPLLDKELRLLPERYRAPLLLCELEGKSHKEAALQLSWPQGTLAGRLSRGRALLARRMARHGAPSVAALALAPNSVSAALASSTAQTALAYAAGKTVVAAHVVALAEGMVKSMLLMKLQVATALLLVATSIGAACVLGAPGAEERPMNQANAQPAQATQPDPEEMAIRAYVEELRAAVKNPADDQHVYRLVIDARFRKALHWAARRGDEPLVAELVRNYCGPNNPDKGGTALTWVAWLNDATAIEILLGRGVDVHGADHEGRTALHEAARWGLGVTKPLLDKGAGVNARTKKGVTPVMLAAAASQPDSLVAMLGKGADVNARDDEGKTPLIYAAENARLDNVKALLAEGADVRLRDKQGKTALDSVRPSNDWLPGAITKERLEEHAQQVRRDVITLQALLKRAGE